MDEHVESENLIVVSDTESMPAETLTIDSKEQDNYQTTNLVSQDISESVIAGEGFIFYIIKEFIESISLNFFLLFKYLFFRKYKIGLKIRVFNRKKKWNQ